MAMSIPPLDGGATLKLLVPGGAVAQSKDLLLSLWTEPYTSDAVKELRRLYQRILNSGPPNKMGSVAVYRMGSMGMNAFGDNQLRAELAALAKEADKVFYATALVIDTAGFVGAALRSAGAGILLLSRPAIPTKFFASFGDGLDWMANQTTGGNWAEQKATCPRTLKSLERLIDRKPM